MRRLFIWVAVIALLWSSWWALATWSAARGADLLMQELRAQGWQVEIDDQRQDGYPMVLRTEWTGLRMSDRRAAVAVEVPKLALSAAAYWPGHLTLDFPQDPIDIDAPDGKFVAAVDNGKARLDLRPGPALQLHRMEVSADAWSITHQGLRIMGAAALRAALVQSGDDRNAYGASLDADTLTPGDGLRAVLALSEDWPLAFEKLTATLSIRFDRPLDRHIGNGPPPQPRALDLHEAVLEWGEISVTAGAALTFDSRGVPTGEVRVTVAEWEVLLSRLAQAFPEVAWRQVELMLRAMANQDNDPGTLDVVVTFRDGKMFLGPIALGPAPRLVLE